MSSLLPVCNHAPSCESCQAGYKTLSSEAKAAAELIYRIYELKARDVSEEDKQLERDLVTLLTSNFPKEIKSLSFFVAYHAWTSGAIAADLSPARASVY